MAADPHTYLDYNKQLVFDIFRKKEAYHRSQARLPIEEKVRILVELQKMALTVRPKQGSDDKRMVWQL